jgi:hypothetical protein
MGLGVKLEQGAGIKAAAPPSRIAGFRLPGFWMESFGELLGLQ